MKNNYLVHAKAKITDDKYTSYSVYANSENEAVEIAKTNFISEYTILDSNIKYKVSKRNDKMLYISLCFIIAAIVLTLIKWAPTTGHELLTIKPNLSSAIFSLAFYSVFIVRIKGIKNSFSTILDIAFSIPIMYLLAALIEIILVTKNLSFLWLFEININSYVILICALVLSMIGLKFISVLCYLGIGVLALSNITTYSNAMGNWGPIFLFFAYLGLLLYIANDITLSNSIPSMVGSIKTGANYIHNDFIEGGKQLIVLKDNAFEKIENIRKD